MNPRQLRTLLCVAVLALAAALVMGCGSSGSSTTSSPSASPSPGDGSPVSQAMEDAIVAGEFDKGSIEPVATAAVKSTEKPGFYFVAVKFAGPSGDQVGVWATKYLDGTTLIWAVDDVARNTTQFPWSSSADGEKLTMETQGAQEAVDALQ